MRIVGNNPQLSRQTQGTASGAITGGKPVIVNTDGTVSAAAISGNAAGSQVEFHDGNPKMNKPVFVPSENKVFLNSIDGSVGRFYTIAISGTTPSVPVGGVNIYSGSNTGTGEGVGVTICSSNGSALDRILIAYQDLGNSRYGTAIIFTPSDGNSGSKVVFESAHTAYMAATYDSNSDRVVINYQDKGNSNYGTAVVGAVSGTSVSFGTPVVYNSGTTNYQASTFDSNSNKVVILYQDGGNGEKYTAIVGTVDSSDNSISFGSEVAVSAGGARSQDGENIAFDTNSNKVLVAYRDNADSGFLKLVVGTVSGTSISFGTILDSGINNASADYIAIAFNPDRNKFGVAFQRSHPVRDIAILEATISGTSVTVGSPMSVNSVASTFVSGSNGLATSIGLAYDTNVDKFLVAYNDDDNGNDGAFQVLTAPFQEANLTSENFIGFAEDTVATGQPVTVNTKGAIADNMPSLPFTITYDSKSFDHSSQDAIAEEIRFKPDGTKFYLLTNDNDIIYQYAMSTAWDISTASYENKSFNVQSQEGTPQAMAINADGTSFYIAGQSRVVYQYNLTTAYDISTASYASKSFSLTTQISSGSAWSLDFDSTGTKMYALGSPGTAYQYTLSSAFDVSTASYASKSLDTTSQTSDSTSFAITSDGTSLYVVSSGSDQVFKYTLSTAFDLATASYSGISLTTTSQDNFPYGVAVKTDETKLYVTGAQNDSVYQYSLSDSLTIGQQYFVQTDGTLSETADSPSVIAGTAVAGSTLIVKG